MKNAFLLIAAAVLALTPVTAAYAATPVSEGDCSAWLTKADKNADGSLGGTEADLYVEKMSGLDMKPKNAGIVSKEEFMAECQKGTFEGIQASN